MLGSGEQLAAMSQGRTLPSVPVAEFDLGGVDAVPVRHLQRRDPPLGQQRSSSASECWGLIAPSAMSVSSECTVSTASDLFVPITPVGPRLIQPVAYSSVGELPIADDPALRVGHPSGGVVEGHALQPHPPIAHGPDDQLRRVGLAQSVSLDETLSVQGSAFDLDRLDSLGTVNADGSSPEVQEDSPIGAGPLPSGEVLEHLEVASGHLVPADDRLAGHVEREVGPLDDDVDAGNLAEFAQLLGGEGGVRGAAPAQDVDVGDLLVVSASSTSSAMSVSVS